MTNVEWAGVGFFLAALVLLAVLAGVWKEIGIVATAWLAVEAVALGGAGIAVGAGMLPLPERGHPPEQAAMVVAIGCAALLVWHVGVVIGVAERASTR